jgi:hypothetical protein
MKIHWICALLGLAGDLALLGLIAHATVLEQVCRHVDLEERARQRCNDTYHERNLICSGQAAAEEQRGCFRSSFDRYVECLQPFGD